MQHFIVLWSNGATAFEADHYASNAVEARKAHKLLFPNDKIVGVKLYKGNGRFV